MLSSVCIRHLDEKVFANLKTERAGHETRMIKNEARMMENNLLSINEYTPVEDWFVENSCAFTPDGSWYWSIKEVTDDIIYLNGCGGTDEIHRIKAKNI
jgi:plasmid stability protein